MVLKMESVGAEFYLHEGRWRAKVAVETEAREGAELECARAQFVFPLKDPATLDEGKREAFEHAKALAKELLALIVEADFDVIVRENEGTGATVV